MWPESRLELYKLDPQVPVHRLTIVQVALQLGVYAYYVWFHPFSKFPGPPLSKIFNLPWLYTTLIKGNGPKSLLGLHQKYGKIVRLGPNHLAIDGSIGFPQVFGNRKVDHPKQANYFLDFPDSIIGSNTEVHRRQRRQLNPAFSESALKEQEPTIWRSVDLLLEKLGEKEASGEPVNIVEWVNFTIFDIIGDLMFAETFHSLERSGYHPWVQSIFTGVRMASIARFLRWYIPNWVLVMCMHLSGVMKLVHQNRAFAKQRSQARMDIGAVPEEGRRDFMTYMMRKDRNGEGLSETEIFANSPLIVGAGSETSATALAGLFFHLAQTPWAYKAVTDEIRTKFSSTDEINAQRVSSLEYLIVCIDETLRIYPPVCESPPRESTADTVVDGNFFPKGVSFLPHHQIWILSDVLA